MIAHTDRGLRSVDRPLVSGGDMRLLLQLPALKAAAITLPEERWPAFCRFVGLGARNRKAADAIAQYFTGTDGVDVAAVESDVRAARLEHYMQVLRAGGRAGRVSETRLSGMDELESALAPKRGAVMWIAHFAFAPLAVKTALTSAGLRVWHLSRPEHGFSKTRFGIAVFNPLRWRVEERYLAGRIVIDRSNPAAATLRASRLLARNGVVSITAGDWEGARVLDVPFGPGTVRISNGAPALAHLTGAALVPVVAVRDGPGQPIDVVLLPPLQPDQTVPRGKWVDFAAERFAGGIAPYVARFPGQWRDWHRWTLRPGSDRAA